jgi:hypothetical protein
MMSAAGVTAAIVGLSACGGTSSGSTAGGSAQSSASTDVVVKVGATPITKGAVSHWMVVSAGEKFASLTDGREIPSGLVSDPPNYAECVAHLEALAGSSPLQRRLTASDLLTKCRQLYQALRNQATSLLVRVAWLSEAERRLGMTVTDAEIQKALTRYKGEQFHGSEAAFSQYLTQRRLTQADELVTWKSNLLAQKATAGGRELYAKVMESGREVSAQTECKPGYVVMYCKQYTGEEPTPEPPASVLLEEIAYLATGHCYDEAICNKL